MSSASSTSDHPGFDPASTSGALRIASIFVILLMGFAGVSTPVFFRKWSSSRIFTVARAFGAGVVLGTALVHVLPSAQSMLETALPDVEYALSGALALVSLVATLILEQIASLFFAAAHAASGHTGCEHGGTCDGKVDAVASSSEEGTAASAQVVTVDESVPLPPQHAVPMDVVGHRFHHHHQRTHEHKVPGMTHEDARKAAHASVVAHVLEVGIGIHSVIIGMAMGASSDVGEVRALMIALSFHQFFEGIALGVSIVEAKLDRAKRWIGIGVFALAVPVGISIGIAIAATAQSGHTVDVTQGVLDAISAGILLYMALVDMVAEAFQQEHVSSSHKPALRVAMLVAAALGAGVMAVIGIWA